MPSAKTQVSTPSLRAELREVRSQPTPVAVTQQKLRSVASAPSLRLAAANTPAASVRKVVRFTPSADPHPAWSQASQTSSLARSSPSPTPSLARSSQPPTPSLTRSSSSPTAMDDFATPAQCLGWVTPKTVERGVDGIIRKASASKEDKENAQTAARTPSKASMQRPALGALLTTPAMSESADDGEAKAKVVRSQFALGSTTKSRTLSRLELGATPFGMPRWELPAPTPTPTLLQLVPSSADKPGLKAAGTSILRAQQAVSEDASTRWKGTIARAKARPKQDRLAVLDDNEAALSWLELRASSGAFALSVS